VAVVTGSAVGLGRAVANRYAREGAAVVVSDTNASDGAAVAKQIARPEDKGFSSARMWEKKAM
jgi:NAD(P)-dependent dehydrogenase (short-subunit alcohol dehydrogenase family)